jgi:hypothetical protein
VVNRDGPRRSAIDGTDGADSVSRATMDLRLRRGTGRAALRARTELPGNGPSYGPPTAFHVKRLTDRRPHSSLGGSNPRTGAPSSMARFDGRSNGDALQHRWRDAVTTRESPARREKTPIPGPAGCPAETRGRRTRHPPARRTTEVPGTVQGWIPGPPSGESRGPAGSCAGAAGVCPDLADGPILPPVDADSRSHSSCRSVAPNHLEG